MNKKGMNEYNQVNRQVKKRRKKDMFQNAVHETEYTFADEYYTNLQDEYINDLIKSFEIDAEEEK